VLTTNLASAASSRLTILYYCSGWPINIGNAFLDLGALAILRAALPDANIVLASEMPRWIFFNSWKEEKRSRGFFNSESNGPKSKHEAMEQALDIGAVMKCDLAVFSGMAMCEEFMTINGPPVLALAKRGIPSLLLGAGADHYNKKEEELFGKFLTELKPMAFISRDEPSFEMFARFVPNSVRGIDCGWFLSNAYTPPPLTLPPYVVSTFDSKPEPDIDAKGRMIVRSHHECWGPSPAHYLQHKNTLISDVPYDYLNLYAFAEEVHSDRVHACVAGLSYGRPVKLYSGSPRSALFDVLGVGSVRDKLTHIDGDMLAEKKRSHIELVRRVVTSSISRPIQEKSS
jgi:hypothetical protein